MKTRLLMGGIALLAMSVANAQSITTIFQGGNFGNAGGGIYFDLTVLGANINVTGFDVGTTAVQGTPFGFQAWTHTGTFAGTETNQGLWTMVATGNGISSGSLLVGSPVTLNAPFTLNTGVNAMALILADVGGGNAVAHSYTNGTGANQQYSNADVQLDLGTATNVPFTAPIFSPRVWNGTVYYNLVPEPGTIAVLGIGLASLLALRRRK
jgi:hypothetical protein